MSNNTLNITLMAGAVDVNFFGLGKVGVLSLHACWFSCG